MWMEKTWRIASAQGIKCGRFSRHTTRYIGYPLKTPVQCLPQSITPIPTSFNSWHKTVLRISCDTFRTYLTRVSRDMSFIFVVYALDLIVKVWFVFIVLVLELHVLFYWFSTFTLGSVSVCFTDSVGQTVRHRRPTCTVPTDSRIRLFIYIFVYIIFLIGTWWVVMF